MSAPINTIPYAFVTALCLFAVYLKARGTGWLPVILLLLLAFGLFFALVHQSAPVAPVDIPQQQGQAT